MKEKVYVCNKDFPRLGLEVGDYFSAERYTEEAIIKALEKGSIVVEESPSPLS